MRDSTADERVLIERGAKLVFASAVDWPGWTRSARSEDEAISTLIAYADRYGEVVRLAGREAKLPHEADFIITDRQPGSSTTDFGAPDVVHALDYEPMTDEECERHLALLRASWQVFDQVGLSVAPRMKKGPRGGGRDRDGIIAHVIKADRTYARKLGVRTPPFDRSDRATVAAHRAAVFAAIPALRDGRLATDKGWPVRYAIRRMAWHILDHAWEMEDKALPDTA